MKLMELYEMQEIAEEYKKIKEGLDNPYSMDNISYLLGITPRHYKKLESPTDSKNNFNDDKLLISSKIFNIHMEDFYK